MNRIDFEMVGRLNAVKERENFKPYEEREVGTKGWVIKTYNFNVLSGTNIFGMRSQEGKFKDDSSKIYVFTKGGTDENGNRIKGEKLTIDFKDRLTHPRLAEVAEFNKYIFDLEKPGRRWALRQAIEKVEDGATLTDEELNKLGISNQEDLKKELELSEKKRKEFISAWDYADFINKVIDSEKYKDTKFLIKGQQEWQYNEANGKYYGNYVPRKIYLADQEEDERATATLDFYFNQLSLDSSFISENGKYYVNGYTRLYDSNRKADIPVPYTIAFKAAADDTALEKKRESLMLKRFEVLDEGNWYIYGITVNLLNGSQREEIKLEDLTEEQQDSILLGELTLEDIQRELGGYTYGERITENVFLKPAKGYSKGREDTVFTDTDFDINYQEESEELFEEETENDEDLFDDII